MYAFGDDIIIGGLNHLVWPAAAQHVWVPQQFLPHAFCGCDRVVLLSNIFAFHCFLFMAALFPDFFGPVAIFSGPNLTAKLGKKRHDASGCDMKPFPSLTTKASTCVEVWRLVICSFFEPRRPL